MDRLAAYFWWDDQQSFDQALMIASQQDVDWVELEEWMKSESPTLEKVARFKQLAGRG